VDRARIFRAPAAVTFLGEAARRALMPGSRWRVIALFRRSIYGQSDAGDVVCLGLPAIGAGPLNGICELADDFEWDRSGLAVGDRASVEAQALRIADLFELSLGDARIWRPPCLPQRDHAVLAEGMAALASELRGRVLSLSGGKAKSGRPVTVLMSPALRAHDRDMPWTLRLFEETPKIEASQIVVPSKPGLGLAFDHAAIKKYQVGP
jgi:hypothetical protein